MKDERGKRRVKRKGVITGNNCRGAYGMEDEGMGYRAWFMDGGGRERKESKERGMEKNRNNKGKETRSNRVVKRSMWMTGKREEKQKNNKRVTNRRKDK